MIWQDWVITIGQYFFAITLLPTLFSRSLPPIKTSFPTSLILYSFAFTFSTLGLFHSTLSSLVVATVWLAIAIKKFKE